MSVLRSLSGKFDSMETCIRLGVKISSCGAEIDNVLIVITSCEIQSGEIPRELDPIQFHEECPPNSKDTQPIK